MGLSISRGSSGNGGSEVWKGSERVGVGMWVGWCICVFSFRFLVRPYASEPASQLASVCFWVWCTCTCVMHLSCMSCVVFFSFLPAFHTQGCLVLRFGNRMDECSMPGC